MLRSQLESWARPGAQVGAQTSHKSIRFAIERDAALARHVDSIFLQGSYSNDTNIRSDSDVDVVVRCPETFQYGFASSVPIETQLSVKASIVPATYGWHEYRLEVGRALRDYYGAAAMEDRDKCFRVHSPGGGVPADVVPVFSYRRYTGWLYEEGVAFHTKTGQLIVNYPKQYGVGLTEKNLRVGNFKPTVRILKNLRGHLTALGRIEVGSAPSHFVEALAWNAPDWCFFSSDASARLRYVLDQVWGIAWADLVRPDGIRPLFGADGWDVTSAVRFVYEAKEWLGQRGG